MFAWFQSLADVMICVCGYYLWLILLCLLGFRVWLIDDDMCVCGFYL